MTKLDLVREHKAEYVTPPRPVLLDVAPAQYLAISGTGRPGSELFGRSMGALFAVAYTIKFASKKEGRDYKVAMPEGLYTVDGGAVCDWTLIMRTPDFITAKHLLAAVKALKAKDKDPLVSSVKLLKLREGRCVQVLHVGPYDREEPTIAGMLAYAGEQGLKPKGRHHEIYLSDPRRVAPEKLKTILRQPVRA